MSLFGTGLGSLSPPLKTGEVSPIPPAAPLSKSSLFTACIGCSDIPYLGSAPGLSTSVVQVNIRLQKVATGGEVQPEGIDIDVRDNPRLLFVSGPVGVVFVK